MYNIDQMSYNTYRTKPVDFQKLKSNRMVITDMYNRVQAHPTTRSSINRCREAVRLDWLKLPTGRPQTTHGTTRALPALVYRVQTGTTRTNWGTPKVHGMPYGSTPETRGTPAQCGWPLSKGRTPGRTQSGAPQLTSGAMRWHTDAGLSGLTTSG